MRRFVFPFLAVLAVSGASFLGACGGDFAGVSGGDVPDGAAADGAPDGTLSDGSALDGGSPVCPPDQPQGACSTSAGPCTYGCTTCFCSTGTWQCEAPGCAGGCLSTPPQDGTSCGGCCGAGVGTSCDYPCPDDASTFRATCVGSGMNGTWQVGPCSAGSGGAGKVRCGNKECDLDAGQACCDSIGADGGAHTCGPRNAGSFCLSGAEQDCDEKADCPSGGVCCLQFLAQGILARCMPTCVTGAERYQACATSAECENSGPCAQYTCPSGESVRTCERPLGCQ
jgi:hypothetical protein